MSVIDEYVTCEHCRESFAMGEMHECADGGHSEYVPSVFVVTNSEPALPLPPAPARWRWWHWLLPGAGAGLAYKDAQARAAWSATVNAWTYAETINTLPPLPTGGVPRLLLVARTGESILWTAGSGCRGWGIAKVSALVSGDQLLDLGDAFAS